MVSCRNLLIYLRPEAQAKVLALFDFSLNANGVLLLGSAETVGRLADRFEVLSKALRLYRKVGRSQQAHAGAGALRGAIFGDLSAAGRAHVTSTSSILRKSAASW